MHLCCPGCRMGGPAPAHHEMEGYKWCVAWWRKNRLHTAHRQPRSCLKGTHAQRPRANTAIANSITQHHTRTSHTTHLPHMTETERRQRQPRPRQRQRQRQRQTNMHTHTNTSHTHCVWQPLAGCRPHEARQPQHWLPPDSVALTQHAHMHTHTHARAHAQANRTL